MVFPSNVVYLENSTLHIFPGCDVRHDKTITKLCFFRKLAQKNQSKTCEVPLWSLKLHHIIHEEKWISAIKLQQKISNGLMTNIMKLVHKKKISVSNLYVSKSNQKWRLNPLAYIVAKRLSVKDMREYCKLVSVTYPSSPPLYEQRDYEVDLKECSSNTCIIKEALLGLKRRRWSPSEAISARDRRADDIWSIPRQKHHSCDLLVTQNHWSLPDTLVSACSGLIFLQSAAGLLVMSRQILRFLN